MDLNQKGNLVPLTVDEDPSLPSIIINNTALHSEAFGNPTDPMLIFLHGGPGGDYRNAYDLKDLSQHGYYVIFYDQRGSGLSQRHPKSTFTIDLMISDLDKVIQYYKSQSNQKVFLFGHSWGAILATAYINQYPSKIDGLILAEPGGLKWTDASEYIEKSRKIDFTSEVMSDYLFIDQLLTGSENEHIKLDYKLSLLVPFTYHSGNSQGIEGPSPYWRFGGVVEASLIEKAENSNFNFTTNLNAFNKKVLFLHSEKNSIYTREYALRIAAPFKNVEIALIENTGHEMIYFGWSKVYPLVLNYLNTQVGL